MPKIDLLPCPFCGSDDITINKSKINGLFAAGCIKCNVTTTFYINENFAAEIWNTRASDWIPCRERMPEECISVLLYGKKIGILKGWFSSYKDFYIVNSGNTAVRKTAVTHWMPLPSVPEVTNNVD